MALLPELVRAKPAGAARTQLVRWAKALQLHAIEAGDAAASVVALGILRLRAPRAETAPHAFGAQTSPGELAGVALELTEVIVAHRERSHVPRIGGPTTNAMTNKIIASFTLQ